MVYKPPCDFGTNTLPPPHPPQGDTERAIVFLCPRDDQTDVTNECPCLFIFYQAQEPWEVLVGGGHLFDPVLQPRREVVGESERLDFRVVVQAKKEVTVARLEGAQDHPLRFKSHVDLDLGCHSLDRIL